jgi:hypothetical protein
MPKIVTLTISIACPGHGKATVGRGLQDSLEELQIALSRPPFQATTDSPGENHSATSRSASSQSSGIVTTNGISLS